MVVNGVRDVHPQELVVHLQNEFREVVFIARNDVLVLVYILQALNHGRVNLLLDGDV